MVAKPAKFITGDFYNSSPVGFIEDPDVGIYMGYPYLWELNVNITPQIISDPREDWSFSYGAADIKSGDWLVFADGSVSVRINEIISIDGTEVVLLVEDVDYYNTLSDPYMMGNGIGGMGTVGIFELDESGWPILGPMPANVFEPVAQVNIISRFVRNGEMDFGSVGGGGDAGVIGTPTDGDINDGAISNWVPGETTVTDAVDDINAFLKKLAPEKPAPLSDMGFDFEESQIVPTQVKLSAGAITNYTGKTVEPGTFVDTIGSTGLLSKPVGPFGSGNSGTLTGYLNSTVLGTVTLTEGTQSGYYGSLRIVDNSPYPLDRPGFWESIIATVGGTAPEGLHEVRLEHSETGSISSFVVSDPDAATPTISNIVATVNPQGVVYSSGIPHLSSGSTVTVSATLANMATLTYPISNNVVIGTEPPFAEMIVNAGEYGIPSEVPNTGTISLTDAPFVIEETHVAAQASLVVTANNSLKTTGPSQVGIKINYLDTTPTDDEPMVRFINEAGFATPSGIVIKRHATPTGTYPVLPSLTFAQNFNSGSESLLGSAGQTHEAVIVGGVLKWDNTNYGSGYTPAGPDYSGKAETQYAMFKFQKIANSMGIAVIGTYQRMLIKLPGVTESMPNAPAGWWDADVAADFNPGMWPGSEGAGNGCMIYDNGYSKTLSFGSISSAFSTDNVILIRFELAEGDVIESIIVD